MRTWTKIGTFAALGLGTGLALTYLGRRARRASRPDATGDDPGDIEGGRDLWPVQSRTLEQLLADLGTTDPCVVVVEPVLDMPPTTLPRGEPEMVLGVYVATVDNIETVVTDDEAATLVAAGACTEPPGLAELLGGSPMPANADLEETRPGLH